MTQIHRIEATNCFCFSTFAVDVPTDGTIIEGGNGRGKTSVLKLLRAALIEKGATPDMIRKGSMSGEIMVRLDNLFVRRVMTAGEKFKTTLRVTDDAGKVVPDGAAFLKNLLGLSPLDPIELFLEKDKGKRRAKILSAIPCTVSTEQLASWCPPGASLVELVGDDGTGRAALADHGLEVIERARKVLYQKRTEANRVVKAATTSVDQSIASETRVYDALSAYRVQHGLPDKAPDLAQAERALDEAKRAAIALAEQRRNAEQSAKAQVRTREKISTLRQKASDLRANQPIAPTDEQFANAKTATAVYEAQALEADAEVRRIEHELQLAKETRDRLLDMVANSKLLEQRLVDTAKRAETAVDEIADIEGQALELEQALGALPIAPSEGQFADADQRITAATALVEYAKKSADLVTYAEAVDRARVQLRAAETDAAALDKAVKALADDAPAALLAAADGIQGLSIDGEDVFLDGVSLDQLSGQERLFFAVEVSRRLNAKSKLLCVDGLEALDAAHHKALIAKATEGGYQLIATRVVREGGDPVATPIHSDD